MFLSQTISHSHFIVVSLPSFLKCRPSTFYAHIYVCIYFSFLSFRLDSRSSVLPIYLSVCVFLPSYSPIRLSIYLFIMFVFLSVFLLVCLRVSCPFSTPLPFPLPSYFLLYISTHPHRTSTLLAIYICIMYI